MFNEQNYAFCEEMVYCMVAAAAAAFACIWNGYYVYTNTYILCDENPDCK